MTTLVMMIIMMLSSCVDDDGREGPRTLCWFVVRCQGHTLGAMWRGCAVLAPNAHKCARRLCVGRRRRRLLRLLGCLPRANAHAIPRFRPLFCGEATAAATTAGLMHMRDAAVRVLLVFCSQSRSNDNDTQLVCFSKYTHMLCSILHI